MDWLDDDTWKRVQASVPIACADVVPVRRDPAGAVTQVGLIRRATPHQGERWCTVGGRLLRGETLAAGVARQIRTTLGDRAQFAVADDPQPAYVAQYFPAARPEAFALVDPRQHAVGMTFVVDVSGDVAPCGEATEFRWFDAAALPGPAAWGFGQERVVRAALARATDRRDAVSILPGGVL